MVDGVLSARLGLDVGVVVGARLLGGDGVDVGETNVGRVEAVGLVDGGDAGVTGLGKDDVDALRLLAFFRSFHVPLRHSFSVIFPLSPSFARVCRGVE